jgi:SNF2 family DNA or RNA helicase
MTFKGSLYPFQAAAVERMIDAKQILLAMDMGLGKTVVSIAAVEQEIDAGRIAGGLIICPASLKYQWQRMILSFTGDEANVVVVDGPASKRFEQYATYHNGRAEYLIINPEQMVGDWDIVSKLPRDFIIADEVQWAKNFKPKRSKKLKKLHATYQWGLTGQPVENRPEEVFSIMEWVDPSVLGNYRTFDRAFIRRDTWGRPRSYRNLPTLHRILSEHMIRHTRAEVADQMPAVSEKTQPIEFDIDGARLYRRIVADLMADMEEAFSTWGNFSLTSLYLGGDDLGEARGRIMSKLTCLRMLCDGPELLRRSAAHFRGEIPHGNRMGSAYAQELDERGLLTPKATPKLDAACDLLTDILDEHPRNKVVVFSFFKDMLDMVAGTTSGLCRSVIFSGAVKAKDRDRVRQQFGTDPDTRLFLSSDAGGVGLDLPMANYLVSLDLPWSAGAYRQRQARIIRLSSEFPEVTLVSLQMADSIEEYQAALLVQKEKIASAVVDGRGISAKGRLNLDLQSLSAFLRTRVV